MLSSVCICVLFLACLTGRKDIVLEAADAVRLYVVDIRSLYGELLGNLDRLLVIYESVDEDVNLLATDAHSLGVLPDIAFESCIEVSVLVADAVLVLKDMHHDWKIVITVLLVACLSHSSAGEFLPS